MRLNLICNEIAKQAEAKIQPLALILSINALHKIIHTGRNHKPEKITDKLERLSDTLKELFIMIFRPTLL